jgi:hypothetical protein
MRWIGGLAMTAASCTEPTTPAEDAAEGDAAVPRFAVPTPSPITTEVIGRTSQPNAQCPAFRPGSWAREKLLQAGSEFLEENPKVLPGDLGRYCRYTWKDTSTPPSDLEVSALVAVLSDAAVDTVAAVPQSGMGELIGPTLTELWKDGIGYVEAENLGDESDRAPVFVAVVDNMPADPTIPNDAHGESLARMIEDIACPGGSPCAVEVQRVLGLPLVSANEVDLTHGGYAGTYGQLAVGIMEAVRRWQVDAPESKLVINLSVGWNADIDGREDPMANPTAPVDAIHDTLQYARCLGAVVVAAAGNDDGTCTTGPLFPAAYEDEAAPSPARCAQFGIQTNAIDGPLVHAVAATRLGGGLLPSTREGGVPRLVATADHARAPSADSQAYSGTSVAAAEVSGALALAWSYAPALSPAALVDALHRGGTPTGNNAEFGLGLDPVHQLEVCGALTEVCKLGGCAFATPCLAGVVSGPALGDLDVVTQPEEKPHIAFSPAESCDLTCDVTTDASFEGVVGACEATYDDPLLRLVNPQPGTFGCPHCTLKSNVLSASLGVDVDPATVSYVQIDLTDAATGAITRVGLGDLGLTTDKVTEVTIDPKLVPAKIKEAVVTVTADSVALKNPAIVL